MKFNGLLWTLLSVGAFLVIALLLVDLRFSNLPHPRVASHNQLMYWVVLRDLKQFEPEIHLALVDRFAEEAAEIFEKNNASQAALSPSQTERLLANIELLKQVWFKDRIATYCDISHPETCEAFMSRQVQLLEDFSQIAFEHADVLYPEKSQEDLTTISDELFADIDRWLTETPADRKEQTLRAVREATVFWLSTQDLKAQVMPARQELVKRVIAELETGMDLAQTTAIVRDQQADQLKRNAMLLMEAWVHLLAEEFSTLPPHSRTDFIDRQIEAVQRWKLLDYLADGSDVAPTSTAPPSLARVNQIVGEWIEQADAVMQPKLKQLHLAFQQRIFLRLLRG